MSGSFESVSPSEILKVNLTVLSELIINSAQEGIVVYGKDLSYQVWNPFMEAFTGVKAENVLGRKPLEVFPFLESGGVVERLNVALSGVVPDVVEFPFEVQQTGAKGWAADRSVPIVDGDGNIVGVLGTVTDITERKNIEISLIQKNAALEESNQRLTKLNEELSNTQRQLIQSEKMASLGLLAAGVAHEINNPLAYVNSNLASMAAYVGELMELLDMYEQIQNMLPQDDPAVIPIRKHKEAIDFSFVMDDICKLVAEAQEGTARVKKIVLDLKEFAHIDRQPIWERGDLIYCLETSLNMLKSELKYKCEIEKNYTELPHVECLMSEISQVFMNILVNAGQAIAQKGVIRIRTGQEGNQVWVEIEDTGKGISEDDMARLFDPFFTTKPIGQGTGLGLSISHGIIEKHKGRIEVRSELSKGATFRVWLPIEHVK